MRVVQNLSSDSLGVSVEVSGDGAPYVTLDNPNPAIPPKGSVSVTLAVATTESGTFDATIVARPANPESQAVGVFHSFSIISSSSSQQNGGLDDTSNPDTAPSHEGRASIPEKAAEPSDGTSDGSSSGRSGGGSSGRTGVGPSSSSDAVYLKEVSGGSLAKDSV